MEVEVEVEGLRSRGARSAGGGERGERDKRKGLASQTRPFVRRPRLAAVTAAP